MTLGEENALEEFIAIFQPQVRAAVHQRVVDHNFCDDVQNNIWMVVWQSAKNYRPFKPVSHWLAANH